MKSEDGRAPQGKPSSTMFGDADLEEAHRKQECSVCLPLVHLWDPGEVDPPARSRPRKSPNFQIFSNLDILVKSIPTTCSTNNNNQHRPQTYVLELTSKF